MGGNRLGQQMLTMENQAYTINLDKIPFKAEKT
jgi:hypothetical protein